jgi:hypothetical protein
LSGIFKLPLASAMKALEAGSETKIFFDPAPQFTAFPELVDAMIVVRASVGPVVE